MATPIDGFETRQLVTPMTTPNALPRTNPESRIREIRPSGLMRGGVRSLNTDNYGRFNFEDLTLPTLLRDCELHDAD